MSAHGDDITLRFPRWRWLMGAAACAAIVAAGYAFAHVLDPTPIEMALGWAGAVGFSLGVVANLAVYVVSARDGLTIDGEGFTIVLVGRTARIDWDECADFIVHEDDKHRMLDRVVFELTLKNPTPAEARRAAHHKKRYGSAGALPPAGYGMEKSELAALLNARRAKALSGRPA